MIRKKILLILFLTERVASQHSFLQTSTGSNFETIETKLLLDHEVRVDFLSPLAIEVPEGKYKSKSELLVQSEISKTLDDGKLRDFHINYTRKSYGCEMVGYQPCGDDSTDLIIGKFLNHA